MIKAELGEIEIGFPFCRALLGDFDIDKEDIPQLLKKAEIFADLGSTLTAIEQLFGRDTVLTMLEDYLKVNFEKGEKLC